MARTIISILVLLFVFPSTYATPYTVGNSLGWSINVDYTTWARPLNFVVNDTLVFNYGPGHSVAEVSSANYKSCNATNPIRLYTSGPTTITLDAVADRYFICAAPHHCDFGQKIAVNVNRGSVPTKPTNTRPSTSTPSAAGYTLGSSQIVLSLVLAATFGLMR